MITDTTREKAVELAHIEMALVKALVEEPDWLPPADALVLRWALSLARVSVVQQRESRSLREVEIGHATNAYRAKLYALLNPTEQVAHKLDRAFISQQIGVIRKLCFTEREELAKLMGNLFSLKSLDEAVEKRPLALALGGGGGTSFVFAGALEALEQENIKPTGIAGTSMGAILGAFRALHDRFDLAQAQNMIRLLSWRNIAEPFNQPTRFGAPATFKLRLREVIGHQFAEESKFLRLCDLPIPLRVTTAGIAFLENHQEPDLSEYAHLLDDVKGHIFRLKHKSVVASQALLNLARRPLKALYLGADPLSTQIEVIDAIGFSAAVPGIFHYDIWRDDPKAIELMANLLKEYNVFRLIDGGFVDNLPSEQAFLAAQTNQKLGRDPFVLALDGFAPNLTRHWLFLPLMRMAAENSKHGREMAHLTITYRDVLSPLTVVPSAEAFKHAVENGKKETMPHLPFIKMMLGPIPRPLGL